jgi:hypothetical protein
MLLHDLVVSLVPQETRTVWDFEAEKSYEEEGGNV